MRTTVATQMGPEFPDPPRATPAGSLNVPGYSITRRIGQGGQAVVYEAVQHSLGRRVALKVLDPVYAEHVDLTQRFLDEGRILANLAHSNVITIHDVGVADELHYIAMELVEGGNLRRRIRAGIEETVVLEYLGVIADCLACAHAQLVVHRDIKPANVLFRRDGTLLLADFGIAKRLDGRELTVAGTTIGSPGYLSPEQVECKSLDGRADIYSLGAMAFEMFTGRRPFVGESDFETMRKHLSAPVPALPAEVARYQPLIDCMMAKRPEERFESAEALLEALETFRPHARQRSGTQEMHSLAARPALPSGESASLAGEEELDPDSTSLDLALCNEATEVNPALLICAPERPTGRRWPARMASVLACAALAGGAWSALPTGALLEHAAVDEPVVELRAVTAPQAAGVPAPASVSAMVSAPDAVQAPGATDRTIEALLERARIAFEDLRLTTPEGDNALGYYRQVLALEPGNAEALGGRDAIADRYLALAQGATDRGEVGRATVLVDRGLVVKPDAQGLLALRSRLQAETRAKDEAARMAALSPPRHGEDPPDASDGSGGEIRGESPAELLRRMKGWFQ